MYSVFHFFSSIGRKHVLETPKIDEKHTCIPVQFLLNQSIDPRRVIEVKRSVNRENEVELGRDTRSPNIPIRSLVCFWCWRCREGNVGSPPFNNFHSESLSLHLVPFPPQAPSVRRVNNWLACDSVISLYLWVHGPGTCHFQGLTNDIFGPYVDDAGFDSAGFVPWHGGSRWHPKDTTGDVIWWLGLVLYSYTWHIYIHT